MVRSEGQVRQQQSDVLGLYRLGDCHQARPLYKQDGGENFIFFSPAGSGWILGTSLASLYGWLRNFSASLEGAWQYRDSLSGSWREDDVTLRGEALSGNSVSRAILVVTDYFYFRCRQYQETLRLLRSR